MRLLLPELITEPTSEMREELIAKIKSAVQSPLARSRASRKAPAAYAPPLFAKMQTVPPILAIGASTGGPKALQDILTKLPAQLPARVLVVQHMPIGFTAPFAERLNRLCQLDVCGAAGEETIEPGTVYIAPQGGT